MTKTYDFNNIIGYNLNMFSRHWENFQVIGDEDLYSNFEEGSKNIYLFIEATLTLAYQTKRLVQINLAVIATFESSVDFLFLLNLFGSNYVYLIIYYIVLKI